MAGTLRFLDDSGSGWLWPGDGATRAAFGPGPVKGALDAAADALVARPRAAPGTALVIRDQRRRLGA